MPVFINNRPIKRTREILINKKTLVTTEMEYKHLVFIHIPRCAGLTITTHFMQRYGSPRLTGIWSDKSLPIKTTTDSALTKLTGIQTFMDASPEFNPKTPLQHQPLSVLRTYRGSLEVQFNVLTRTICCVRNPYDRVISGMFHLGYINQYNSPDEVFTQMLSYLKTSPPATQVSFITDEFGNISNEIRIIRVESIVADMHALGYTDFTGTQRLGRGSWTVVRGEIQTPTYAKYLNDESRELIQHFFDNDFKIFNYTY
jgi:hypothetical protein